MLTKIITMNKIYDETKSINKLFRIVTNVFGISKQEMTSKTRKRAYVEAKTMFAVIARQKLLLSTVEIGELIKRDHSSVIHYSSVHKDLYKVDKTYRRMFNLVSNVFTDQPFMADKILSVDDKLSIAHIKLDTLEKENEQLREAMTLIKEAVLTY